MQVNKFSYSKGPGDAKKAATAFFIEFGFVVLIVVGLVFVLVSTKTIKLSFVSQKTSIKNIPVTNSQLQVQNDKTQAPVKDISGFSIIQHDIQKLKTNNALHYAVATVELEGILRKTDVNGGVVPGTSQKYKLSLLLSVGSNTDTYTTYYTEKIFPKIKYFDKIGNKQTPILFSDLKPGDKLTIRQSYYIFQPFPSSTNNVTIIRR